ncbi:hypothetical protein HOY80DRAFT_951105 [Tuber brumale]|nr:hypothetical protein HOY80DRAFT_951105 [Tuber brumale]
MQQAHSVHSEIDFCIGKAAQSNYCYCGVDLDGPTPGNGVAGFCVLYASIAPPLAKFSKCLIIVRGGGKKRNRSKVAFVGIRERKGDRGGKKSSPPAFFSFLSFFFYPSCQICGLSLSAVPASHRIPYAEPYHRSGKEKKKRTQGLCFCRCKPGPAQPSNVFRRMACSVAKVAVEAYSVVRVLVQDHSSGEACNKSTTICSSIYVIPDPTNQPVQVPVPGELFSYKTRQG